MGSITHHLQEEEEEAEGLVCGTCGDQGFTNAFVYCVKCLDVAIHRYCLDEMPKTFYERVIWCCEHCQVKSSQSRKEEAANAGHVNVTHIKKKHKKERDIVSLIAETKEVTSRRHIKEHAHNIPKKAFTKRKKNAARLAAKKKEYKLPSDLENGIQESCTLVDIPISYTPSKMKHKELISDSSSMEEESGKNADHECQAETGTNVCQSADIENYIQDNYYICAQPVIETVWRGSFIVIGAKYDPLGRIFAHLSTKACDKVFQEANMMPSLLHLEMQPKIFLWPKSFQEREPSDDSIALYFFPGDPINEKIFDHFVQDMMDKELAMRAPTKNAELLIFTSMVLPHCFQKFQGKYYLWGVFRGKRDDPTSVVSHNLTVPNSSDQCALLKRVDVAVQPFVEHVDNPMGQPTLREGSEHIPNSSDQFALSKRVDVVETFVEPVDNTMGQPILYEGSEHIPNNSDQISLSKCVEVVVESFVEHVHDAMGQPIPCEGSENIPKSSEINVVVGPFFEHVDDAMGPCEGSGNIPKSSGVNVVEPSGEYMDDAMGPPILSEGSEHIHGVNAVAEAFVEHMDDAVGQPNLCEGSESTHRERIENSRDQHSLSICMAPCT